MTSKCKCYALELFADDTVCDRDRLRHELWTITTRNPSTHHYLVGEKAPKFKCAGHVTTPVEFLTTAYDYLVEKSRLITGSTMASQADASKLLEGQENQHSPLSVHRLEAERTNTGSWELLASLPAKIVAFDAVRNCHVTAMELSDSLFTAEDNQQGDLLAIASALVALAKDYNGVARELVGLLERQRRVIKMCNIIFSFTHCCNHI